MKILLLANNQQNVDAIKANIQSIEEYCKVQIGNLSDHQVHEVNDVIHFQSLGAFFKGGRVITWKTDNPVNKIDETEYDIMIVYKRFVDEDRNLVTALIYTGEVPVGIVKDTKFNGY